MLIALLFAMFADPQLVFVSTKPCPSCVVAKAAFEKVDKIGYEVAYLSKADPADEARVLQLKVAGPVPQILMVEGNEVIRRMTGPLTRNKIEEFVALRPVECFESLQLTMPEPEPIAYTGNEVVIKWALKTQYRNGAYNGSAAFNRVEHALNALGRYWKVRYQRVNRGEDIEVVQASYSLGTDVAARTGGRTMLISPTFRFVNSIQFEMVVLHEAGHFTMLQHHAQDGGLMGPSGGYLLNPNDWPYFSRREWRGTLRPNQEPTWLKEYFSGLRGYDLEATDYPLMNRQR